MDKNETNRNNRRRQSRPMSSYSVDMAAQRGISGGTDARTNDRNSARQNGRSVDVAEERRRSGRVDVMTGRPLSGRVQMPVSGNKRTQPDMDRRRNVQTGTDADRRRTVQTGTGADRRTVQTGTGTDRRRTVQTGTGTDRRKTVQAGSDTGRKRNAQRSADTDRRFAAQGGPDKRKRTNKGKRRKAKKRRPTPEQLARIEKERQVRLKKRQERLRRLAAAMRIALKVLLVLAVISLVAFVYIRSVYKLKHIEVTGTDHYSDEEIVDIVTGGKVYGNTLLFLFESRINPAENVTFIDKINVEYVDRNAISITVYEKAMAGCIESGGQYAYFDGDGIVLELSDEKLPDVPCIEGLTSDSVEQGEKLSVGDESFFQEILIMTQLIYKNNMDIDKITYDDNQNLILHKGDIKIKIGGTENLEEKFRNLDSILSTLDGRKGTLDMTDSAGTNGEAIFKENK